MQHTRSNPLRVLLAAVAACCLATPAQALSVFTCEPEWASLVRQLAPDAEVRSATHARQDPHHIEARPSLIAALRRADLAVCTGASLEAGWLPMLQQRAGNPRVRDGAAGMLYAADHVALIDPRPPGSPFDGDVHSEGNPHVHLDPWRVLDVAEAVRDAIAQVAPARREQVHARHAAWERDWRARITQWERKAAPLRGTRVAAQHTTFAYLWNWLGIDQVADLEPKPGMPPTPGHLQRVLEAARAAPPRAVVVSIYQDARPAQWLGQQFGVPVLQLPSTVLGEPPAPDLAALYDHLLERLLALAR
ncbi:zinc ABC transporter substrate-binding protein [Ramlibacter sp. AN1015]|uniref:metal ABC transporter solute-binding protein, Zn/Mn family n=1 Tax=Ramlibacter sp. AN1015 TaxID=3133428 RepID=UPI0030BFAEDF